MNKDIQENAPEVKQTTSIIEGQVFITTEKVQKDINGTEFVILRTVQPYNKSIEEYKTELEEIRLKQLERHDAVIADIDTKIAEADKAK